MNAMINLSYTTSKNTKRRALRKGTSPSLFTPSTSSQDLKVLRAVHMLDTFDRITVGNTVGVPFGPVSRVLRQLQNSGYIVPLNKARVFQLDELNAFPWPKGHLHNYDSGADDSISSAVYEKTISWPSLMKALTKTLKPKRKKKAVKKP